MANLQTNSKSQSGFTIVELLIVIVVIGILAAITIVAYSGISARASAAKYQTDAVALFKKAEAYNATTGGYLLTAAGADPLTSGTQTAAGIALTTLYNNSNESRLPTNLNVFAVAASAPSFAQAMVGINVSSSSDSYFVQYCTTGKGMYVYYPDPTTSTVKSMSAGVCP